MSTPKLDRIAANGNRPPVNGEDAKDWQGDQSCWIRCKDGFRLSVTAGGSAYCAPRPPYKAVEVGFPSSRPEPWRRWKAYAANSQDPTETVYAYVPVELVRALIESHGGEA
jgi:hypothetical protein